MREEMQMPKREYVIMILSSTLFAIAILGGLEIIRFYSLIVGLLFMISFLTASIILFERQEKRLEDMGFFDDEDDDFYDEDDEDELDDEDDYVDLSLSSIISLFKHKNVDDNKENFDEDYDDYDDFDDEEDDFEYDDEDELDDEKTSSLAEIIDFPRCFK